MWTKKRKNCETKYNNIRQWAANVSRCRCSSFIHFWFFSLFSLSLVPLCLSLSFLFTESLRGVFVSLFAFSQSKRCSCSESLFNSLCPITIESPVHLTYSYPRYSYSFMHYNFERCKRPAINEYQRRWRRRDCVLFGTRHTVTVCAFFLVGQQPVANWQKWREKSIQVDAVFFCFFFVSAFHHEMKRRSLQMQFLFWFAAVSGVWLCR